MKTTLTTAALLAALAAASSASAQTTLAEFQFNEGSGTTTASRTNVYSGTLGLPLNPDAAPIISTASPSGAAGDRCVELTNGAFLVVDDSATPILANATSPLTMEAWVKRSSASTAVYEGIMGYGGAYKLGLNNSELIFTLFGVVDVSSGLSLTLDEWHHVAAVWEPGVGVTFYLDGTSAFTPETGAMGPFLNNYLNLGAERLGTPITGSIDRLRIHKALLTADQLDSVAATPKAPLADTLVSYPLNEAALPHQNAAATPRPTVSGNVFVSQQMAPTWVTDSPSGRAGDYALEFSGGRRVVVPDPDATLAFNPDDPSFTIQAWVKFGPQAARAVLFFNNAPGGAVSFSVNNRRVFVTTLGIVDQTSNAVIPDDGGWHHIAVVHQFPTELRFYVDGILGDTVPYTRGVIFTRTQTEFYLGSEPTGGLPYNGKMDRLMVTSGVVAPENLDFRPIPGVDPGAPELSIQTMVEVSWPSLPAGYQLQVTTTPAVPASWTAAPGTPFTVDGTYKYYAPVTAQQQYYRLVKP